MTAGQAGSAALAGRSVNDHHRLDPASLWGGVKPSGIGREFGPEFFDDLVDNRSS